MEAKYGKTHVEMTLQHLEYGSVIAGGWPNPHSLLKIFEAGRALTKIHRKKICQEAGISEVIMVFMAWQQMEFLPSYYDQRVDPGYPISHLQFINRKLKLLNFANPVQTSSQSHKQIIFDVRTDKALVHLSSTIVNIDPKTRRPTPFHPLLKRYYSPENCTPSTQIDSLLPPLCQKKFEMPRNVKFFTKSVTITVFQLDVNGHANHAAYVELALGCLGDAFAKLTFEGFTSIFNRDLRRISFLYLKECRFGDLVSTTVWQDSMNPLIFKFHITNASDLSCQVEVEFFPCRVLVKSPL